MTGRLAWGIAALLLAGAAPSAWAADEGIIVNGDQIEYHETEGFVLGRGRIVATYQDTKLTCDRAIIYMATKDAFLSGRVIVYQPGGLLKGDEVLYNFETRKGSVLRAEGVAEPWRAAGDQIDKVADHGFVAREGYLTSCDFEQPHYRIQGRQVRIIPGDRVTIKHAVIYVGPVPILYVPSYTHPLDDRRPRVTLTPGESKEWGAFLLTSWRYYLHENLQGRIHVDYRERRDLALGVDTRYRLADDNEGILRTYYTHERLLGREHIYSSSAQGDPTVEQERYRVQWRHRWEVDRDTTATAEYHQTRDSTFLQDFFEREFEEDISPKTYVQVLHSKPGYAVSLLGRKRVNRFEADVERLPELRFDTRPTSVDWTKPWLALMPWRDDLLEDHDEVLGQGPWSRWWRGQWYYQSNSTYSALYSKPANAGLDQHVRRLDTVQQLSYQIRLLRAVNVTPLIKTEQTWFSKMAAKDEGTIRGVMETGVDLSTKFYRIFDLELDWAGIEIHRLRHIITPSLGYRYRPSPTVPSRYLMQFDGVDAIDKTNSLTPSLEQKLQTKRRAGTGWRSVDLARFVLSTDYTFKGENDSGGQMGNVSGDLELRPYPWLLAETDTVFSAHRRQFQSLNFDLVLTPAVSGSQHADIGTAEGFDRRAAEEVELPWAAGFGWRWQRQGHAQITAETVFNLGSKWRIGLYERLDVRKFVSSDAKFVNRPAESELRIRRDLHEWTVELVWNRHRAEGSTLLLLFRLKAFPDQPLEFQRSYNRPKLGTRRALFAG